MKTYLSKLARNQEGLTLVETLISLVILGLVAIAILSGLATGAKTTVIAKEQTMAESLARSEIEYIKSLPYQHLAGTYPVDPALAAYEAEGWHIPPPVVALVHASDDGLQKISISIERNGKSILTLSSYKVDR